MGKCITSSNCCLFKPRMTDWMGNTDTRQKTWCRHQIEIFSALLALCEGIHRWIPPTKASDAQLRCCFFIRVSIKRWVTNREAGVLGRHRAPYFVALVINAAVGVFVLLIITGIVFQVRHKTLADRDWWSSRSWFSWTHYSYLDLNETLDR